MGSHIVRTLTLYRRSAHRSI